VERIGSLGVKEESGRSNQYFDISQEESGRNKRKTCSSSQMNAGARKERLKNSETGARGEFHLYVRQGISHSSTEM
jgi:hypothetical protein